MARFEMDFTVLKNEEGGEVIGFSLIAQAHTESEIFCDTFPKAFLDKEADIRVEGEELVFSHPTCRYSGDHRVEVDPKDLEAIQALLEGERQLSVQRDGMLTRGFKIVLPQEAEASQ